MKANHNRYIALQLFHYTVSYGSKILKWKQITTVMKFLTISTYCFLWFKDTKMKANHNQCFGWSYQRTTVSYGSKILKWKQITTMMALVYCITYCFLWFKDTKMKANHNCNDARKSSGRTVSYGSKILKWKQITTRRLFLKGAGLLFPMVQRY